MGEAVLSGCTGFQSSRSIIRGGKSILGWQIRLDTDSQTSTIDPTVRMREVWSRIDFEGPSKKLIEVRLCPVLCVPQDLMERGRICNLLQPKDCVLQVSSSSLGGEFVDVKSVTLSKINKGHTHNNSWETFGGFRTNRSKSWRIVVKNYYSTDSPASHPNSPTNLHPFFVGLNVQLMEADIAMDNLQRLHVLHNASLSLTSLVKQRQTSNYTDPVTTGVSLDTESDTVDLSSTVSMKKKIQSMQIECHKIESLYMDAARTIHTESQHQLREATKRRQQHENNLALVTKRVTGKSKSKKENFWTDCWWDDLLSICFLKGTHSERISLYDKVAERLNDFYTDTVAGQSIKHRFPHFHDVGGLRVALNIYIEEVGFSTGFRSYLKQLEDVKKLSPHPNEAEVFENSNCGKCRADWKKTGPTCSHCKLDKALEKRENDSVLILILTVFYKWSKELRLSSSFGVARNAARIDERAENFLKIMKTVEKERLVARNAWRTHFDLLSDIDELNQCKQAMQLAQPGEDVTKMSEEDLNFTVPLCDIATRVMDHTAKQAMSIANLRRNKDTLRYLKNQHIERQEEFENSGNGVSKPDDEAENCIVCLAPFEGERAVLVSDAFDCTSILRFFVASTTHLSHPSYHNYFVGVWAFLPLLSLS